MAMNRMSCRRWEKIEQARNKAFGKRWRRLWYQRQPTTTAEMASLSRILHDYIHRNDPITLRMGYSREIPRRIHDAAVDIFVTLSDPKGAMTVQMMKDRYRIGVQYPNR